MEGILTPSYRDVLRKKEAKVNLPCVLYFKDSFILYPKFTGEISQFSSFFRLCDEFSISRGDADMIEYNELFQYCLF